MAIKFSNSIFVGEHEKQPQGFGHWAFIVRINNDKLTEQQCPFEHYQYNNHAHSLIWASEVMNLTKAKKEIKSWLASMNYKDLVIYVAD